MLLKVNFIFFLFNWKVIRPDQCKRPKTTMWFLSLERWTMILVLESRSCLTRSVWPSLKHREQVWNGYLKFINVFSSGSVDVQSKWCLYIYITVEMMIPPYVTKYGTCMLCLYDNDFDILFWYCYGITNYKKKTLGIN